MKKFCTYLSIVLCALFVSCDKIVPPESPAEHAKGDLTLHFRSEAPLTKAGGTAALGDKMNNVRVYLIDENTGNVVGFASTGNGNVTIGVDSTTATATIQAIDRGIYTMYALANAPAGTPWDNYTVGTPIDNAFTNAVVSLPVDVYEPTYSSSQGMPLSLVKSVNIFSGANNISGELLRICARIKIHVANRTSEAEELNLCVTSLSLAAKNPDQSYVFTDGTSVPAYGTRAFKTYSNTLTPLSVIESGEEVCLIDTYLFETGPTLGSLDLIIEGAVLPSTLTPNYGELISYSVGDALTPNNTVNGKRYLIKNNSYNFYLKADGAAAATVSGDTYTNTDVLGTNAGDAFENYLWTVGGRSGSTFTLQNYHGKFLSIPSAVGGAPNLAEGSQTTTYNNNGSLYIRNGRYYQIDYNGSLRITRNNNLQTQEHYYWRFYEVTASSGYGILNATKNFQMNHGITYVDEYGAPVILDRLMRNTELNVLVNIYYSQDTNEFNYELLDWTDRDYETTFD